MTEKFTLLLLDTFEAHQDRSPKSVYQSTLNLEKAFEDRGLPVRRMAAGTAAVVACQSDKIDVLSDSDVVVICGAAGVSTFNALLEHFCKRKRTGCKTLVVTDALQVNDSSVELVLEQFDSSDTQLCTKDAVFALLDLGGRFVYPYAKVDISASVVVFFDHGKRVLLVKRKFAPHQGCFAFPSGFLRPLLEDLPGCACRELFEETGLKLRPDQLEFINVRSNPARDPRGHVIDLGYWKLVSKEEETKALQELQAGDDAEEVALYDVSKAVCLPLAADHGSLLIDACHALGNHASHRAVEGTRQGSGWALKLPSVTDVLAGIRRKLRVSV